MGFLIPNSLCRPKSAWTTIGLPYFCWDLKPQGMIFPGGEAVVVFPAPNTETAQWPEATSLRLFSTEFHP